MNVQLCHCAALMVPVVLLHVDCVDIDRLLVDVGTQRLVGEFTFRAVFGPLIWIASAIAFVCRILLVQPQAVETHGLLKVRQKILPPSDCLLVHKISINDVARQALTDKSFSNIRGGSNEDTKLCPIVVGRAAGALGKSCLDNRNKVAVLLVQVTDKLREACKCLVFDLKIHVIVHVVQVNPLGIKWDPVPIVIRYTIRECLRAFVPAAALMPAESPLRWHRSVAYDGFVILQDHVVGRAAEHDVHLAETARRLHF